MPLTKTDLKQIKETVVDAVNPYFVAIQKDFGHVYERFNKIDGRFDRIEKLMLADHQRRIEKLEEGIKELRGLLAA